MSVMSCGWKSLYGHLWSQPAPLWALCLREAANQCELNKDCFGLWVAQSKRTKLWSRKSAARVLMLFYNLFMHTCSSQTPQTQSCSVRASRCSEQLDFVLSVFSCSCFTVQILVEHFDFRETLQNSGRRNVWYQLRSVCKRGMKEGSSQRCSVGTLARNQLSFGKFLFLLSSSWLNETQVSGGLLDLWNEAIGFSITV